MSSNLVKSYFTTKETSAPRIIDNNNVVEELVEKLRIEATEQLTVDDAKEYDWENFGPADYPDNSADEGMMNALVGDSEGEEEGNPAFAASFNPAEANAMRDKILAEAEAEKKRIMEEAMSEVTMMKNLAYEELARDKAMATEAAKSDGYEIGMKKAEEEFERMKSGLEAERMRLEEEYEDRMFELEPQFVRHITNIYEKVFRIELSDKKDIVLNILRNAMQKIEGTKNYIIHVSRDDYAYVSENKAVLLEASLAPDVIIDVVEDMTMRNGDCMIETANGIFDCGIDTQLSAIKKRLTLLSYDGRD